eukprot:TRINITY_DN12780_c0_g1_i1.p1 TRINITY_DN12780_c0_g1~~TRINITY_DN12780_c0_g1_i1.p1  ORF type:complete len:174 (-),score=28.35 TRINITY_DN12780_c0_g1_i1:411-884(-)
MSRLLLHAALVACLLLVVLSAVQSSNNNNNNHHMTKDEVQAISSISIVSTTTSWNNANYGYGSQYGGDGRVPSGSGTQNDASSQRAETSTTFSNYGLMNSYSGASAGGDGSSQMADTRSNSNDEEPFSRSFSVSTTFYPSTHQQAGTQGGTGFAPEQ